MRYYKDTEKFVKDKKVFCGIDMHFKHWNLCLLCDGEIIEKQTLPSDYHTLRVLLKRYAAAREISIVYEAGFSGFWLYRKLTQDGYSCIVTHPNRIPKTGTKVKTDRRDAESLASYLSAGILKPTYIPPLQVESDRRIVRLRSQLVKKQRRVKNQIKAFLHLHGIKTPEVIKSHWTKKYLAWLENLVFEYPSDGFTLSSLVLGCRQVREELVKVDLYLRHLSHTESYHVNFMRVTSLRGIGLITAMTFLLELHDMNRFKNVSHFSGFLGMTPSQHSSGEHVRLGHITRQGNAYLRMVLVESAWTVIRHDPHLREKYNRIRMRGTNGKKAIVAVARSLAIRLRRCLLDETPYRTAIC
jgi:transposase